MNIKYDQQSNFAIVATLEYSHAASFTVYRVCGWKLDGSPDGFAGPDDAFVDTVEDAEVYMHGSVKWDGCSNWHIDDQDECMLHFCSREELADIGRAMQLCWDWTAELLPTWDESVAGPVGSITSVTKEKP
jgi:hypothetical protein